MLWAMPGPELQIASSGGCGLQIASSRLDPNTVSQDPEAVEWAWTRTLYGELQKLWARPGSNVHLPHFHFQRDEYGHANNEGPRKRKWEAQNARHETGDPWKDSDWREGRDDWFDGRPQVRNWEEDWEGPEERPAGMKMSGGIFARAMGAIVRKDDDDGRGDVETVTTKRRAVPKNAFCIKSRKDLRVDEGYEPNDPTVLTFDGVAMVDRASSEPSKGTLVGEVNPFWSDRNRREIALQASRPLGLPEQSPASTGVEPLRDGPDARLCIGKGRGGGLAPAKSSCFVTPPSKLGNLDGGDEFCPRISEGRMPEDDGQQGRKTTEGRVEPEPNVDGLQRDLEAELVNHLRVQNSQLMEELDRVKALLAQPGNGSTSSWSEVGGDSSACAGKLTGKTEDGNGRMGYQTPRSFEKSGEGKRDARYTPNGTRVPDGTPPDDVPVIKPPPKQDLPAVPPFPPSFMTEPETKRFLDSYETVETKSKVLKSDQMWRPSHEMAPREARAFWLEQEVASLRKSLAKVTDGNPFQGSEYWSKGFQPTGHSESAFRDVSACAGIPPEVSLQDRAGSSCAVHRNECPGHLLSMREHGEVRPQARASASGIEQHTECPGGCGEGIPDRSYGPWSEGGSMNTKTELPDLPANSSPLQFGDWIHLSTPTMKDISGVAGWWWESTLREAKCYYEQWKTSSPLQRIQIRPMLPESITEQRFQRTEQRGVQMLLKAIPVAEQQELVTDRSLSSTAILYKLMAETLCLMVSTPKTEVSTPLKLKPMDAASFNSSPKPITDASLNNGKGKGGSTADVPCKWFRGDSGCRAGQKCKSVAPKNIAKLIAK
eukprot:s2765_g4.t1